MKRSTPDQNRQSLDVVREGVVEERTDSRSCPWFLLSSRDTIIPKFVKIMSQVITAKLKLKLTAEQKALVSQTALAYRDALNYTSQVAFDAGKTSNGALVTESGLQLIAGSIWAGSANGLQCTQTSVWNL